MLLQAAITLKEYVGNLNQKPPKKKIVKKIINKNNQGIINKKEGQSFKKGMKRSGMGEAI